MVQICTLKFLSLILFVDCFPERKRGGKRERKSLWRQEYIVDFFFFFFFFSHFCCLEVGVGGDSVH
jgi:hypothetical protein